MKEMPERGDFVEIKGTDGVYRIFRVSQVQLFVCEFRDESGRIPCPMCMTSMGLLIPSRLVPANPPCAMFVDADHATPVKVRTP